MLGMTQEDLLDNDAIQSLLTKQSESKQLNSSIKNDKKGGRIVKVHNFQALLNDSWKAEV